MKTIALYLTHNHLLCDFTLHVKFAALANIDVIPCDISLSGRVLAAFPEWLKLEQRVPDNLKFLGELCKRVSKSIHYIQLCDDVTQYMLIFFIPP